MPVRRKTKNSKRKSDMRVRFKEDPPVETDLKYWLIHAAHWHALLFAVIVILVIGRSLFSVTGR